MEETIFPPLLVFFTNKPECLTIMESMYDRSAVLPFEDGRSKKLSVVIKVYFGHDANLRNDAGLLARNFIGMT